jgi:hypothetical protein
VILRTSQNIRAPEKPETALSLALKQALEWASCTCTHAREFNRGGQRG